MAVSFALSPKENKPWLTDPAGLGSAQAAAASCCGACSFGFGFLGAHVSFFFFNF